MAPPTEASPLGSLLLPMQLSGHTSNLILNKLFDRKKEVSAFQDSWNCICYKPMNWIKLIRNKKKKASDLNNWRQLAQVKVESKTHFPNSDPLIVSIISIHPPWTVHQGKAVFKSFLADVHATQFFKPFLLRGKYTQNMLNMSNI